MRKNDTEVTSFILLGFTNRDDILVGLFIIFLLIYVFTLLGNICIIAVTLFNDGLNKPMYFFLGNLAFLDILYSTVIAPKMLSTFLMKDKSITYSACVVQMFLFATLITSESVLLAIMAYDRYLAICNPLRYPAIMTTRFCAWLVCGAYLNGLFQSLFHTCFTFHLTFCKTEISYFFCDMPPLLKLSCTDTTVNEMILFTFCGFNEGGSALVVIVSYFFIIASLIKIRSGHGRSKATSTCLSHFVVFTLYYGSLFFIYLRPAGSRSMETDRVASVVYTVAIPMLNPIIYSLRNSDFKMTFQKLLSWKCSLL
ncbi:PREDICTED: olfactory receptor 5AS1-like [Nanorana parkeri]|uniref:olfactory receptor 5AS1-like n=1 Tax=Nanorana parkeri TaxID=125878 RepID=UPI000854D84F|nr:PREDICTED: olfactory receptor 5AS1-like [Nanorana parkeri]